LPKEEGGVPDRSRSSHFLLNWRGSPRSWKVLQVGARRVRTSPGVPWEGRLAWTVFWTPFPGRAAQQSKGNAVSSFSRTGMMIILGNTAGRCPDAFRRARSQTRQTRHSPPRAQATNVATNMSTIFQKYLITFYLSKRNGT
jgi:hypothetical protein